MPAPKGGVTEEVNKKVLRRLKKLFWQFEHHNPNWASHFSQWIRVLWLREAGIDAHEGGGVLDVQRSAKRLISGCEKFVPAVAYLFCLPLPGSCLARFAYLLADLCIC